LLAHVVGVLMLVAACTAVVLIVGAVRQLNYAGRPAHVLAVCLCCLFAAGIFGIFAAGSFLFPFGSGH
jgi:hypothetical protein